MEQSKAFEQKLEDEILQIKRHSGKIEVYYKEYHKFVALNKKRLISEFSGMEIILERWKRALDIGKCLAWVNMILLCSFFIPLEIASRALRSAG